MEMKLLLKVFCNPNYVIYVIYRALFGVRSSHFLLTTTINNHIKPFNNEGPKFVEQTLRLLHVNDLNSGRENILDYCNFYNKSKVRLNQASINLQKFQSNLNSQIFD